MNIISLLRHLFRPSLPILPRVPPFPTGQKVMLRGEDRTSEYPMVLHAAVGTRIVPPSVGRSGKRGPGEGYLALCALRHKLKGFTDNVTMATEGHRYVPDLAYINAEAGVCIDIECDEPYTMHTLHPTHYRGKDSSRNQAVTAAGWTVVRFAEEQCFADAAGCLRAVMDVARAINPDIVLPERLAKVHPVQPLPTWTYRDAQTMAEGNRRYQYQKRKPEWRIYHAVIGLREVPLTLGSWFYRFCMAAGRLQYRLKGKTPRRPPSRSSKGERMVEEILRRHGYHFETQYPFGDIIHVDFAVHYNNQLYFIEYDGRQHYHPVRHFGGRWRYFLQRLHDTAENMECRKRRIPLLRIRYNVPRSKMEGKIIAFLNA